MGKKENSKSGKLVCRLFTFTLTAVFIVATMTVMAGCRDKNVVPVEVEKPLKLYFVNQEFVDTGDESKGALVEYENISIYLPETRQEDMTAEEHASLGYTSAVTMLWQVPEELEGADTAVTEEFTINNIICKDKIAYVDLAGAGLAGRGGSSEETLFISQIVETLINSFEEIEQVQFLVDGEPAESLMGHCYTGEPFSEGLVKAFKD